MRIESQPNIAANAGTNVADLLGRLDKGDVIQAKVMEVKSGEIVLRLYDGSVLKAAAGEGLEAKVGQTLTLSVTARSEGTLYLETFKGSSPTDKTPNAAILKNLLESLNIKPDARNSALAAAFIKAGIPVTSDKITQAASLMAGFKSLDAEKAVFIISKGLQTGQINLSLLTKLLDGDLKLGEQLKQLQEALNQLGKSAGKNAASDPPAATQPKTGTLQAAGTGVASSAGAGTTSSAGAGSSVGTGTNAAVSAAAPDTSAPGLRSGVSPAVPGRTPSGMNSSTGSGAADAAGQAGMKGTAAGSPEVSALQTEPAGSGKTAISTPYAKETSAAGSKQLFGDTPDTGTVLATVDNKGRPAVAKDGPQTVEMETLNAASRTVRSETDGVFGNRTVHTTHIMHGDGGKSLNSTASEAAATLSRWKDSIQELFVRTDSENLASELEAGKLQKNLTDRLDMLKAAFHTYNASGASGGESIAAAAAFLDDSMKLMNQLNNSNMLYYQLPVNITGQNTTAELFVMNRKKNKKRLDPHNAVMFISLDTNSLGRIETLLDLKDGNISIGLRTESQHINDFVRENIKFLYNGLSQCGYKLVDVKYSVIEAATTPVKLEEQLSGMAGSSYGKVDLRI